MIRSLRKGSTNVEVFYKFDSESISASKTEIDLKENHAIFRLTLTPVDDNQSYDADKMLEQYLSTITKFKIDDEKIRQGCEKFIKAYKDRIEYVDLEVVYKTVYKFSCSIKITNKDYLFFEIS